jgi:hypothetical protein
VIADLLEQIIDMEGIFLASKKDVIEATKPVITLPDSNFLKFDTLFTIFALFLNDKDKFSLLFVFKAEEERLDVIRVLISPVIERVIKEK